MKRIDPKNLTLAQRRDPGAVGIALDDVTDRLRCLNTRTVRGTIYEDSDLREKLAFIRELALWMVYGQDDEDRTRLKALAA